MKNYELESGYYTENRRRLMKYSLADLLLVNFAIFIAFFGAILVVF